MNNTLFSLTQYALSELKDTYSENEIRSICRLIFMDVLKYTNINIHLKKYESLPESFVNKFYNITVRLKKNEPIQYIIGETEFAGLRFKLSPAVLIPRPETEELIYWIKESVISPRQVLDIGTGSGCIAITLARAFPSARVQAVDVSEEALQIARHNAISNAAPVLFQQKDILNYKAEKEEKYDLIVSNPPYVRQCEKKKMQKQVLDFEPPQALFVPDESPLLFYHQIAKLAQAILLPEGSLFFEINEAFGKEIQEMLRQLNYQHIELKQDIFGKDRFVKCKK
ncbi:peptide chain release factor N(5)-glutamine methyltransferase [Odoribacter laneus]|uniref:peptide chain release factor N(5)-glutamine methyltransferase n=1 Tax=Odoribacter laneus TaxID=626933 RepID=UPI0023EF94A0|nr:peptide chain release factor N(5)-glutamine methyltransferase [Odoribacter laneus]